MDGRTDGRTDKPTELSAISGWMTTSLNLFRGDANLCFKPTVHQKSLISFRDKNHRGKNQAKRDSTRPLSLALSLSHLTANEIRYTFQIFKPFFFRLVFFFQTYFSLIYFYCFFLFFDGCFAIGENWLISMNFCLSFDLKCFQPSPLTSDFIYLRFSLYVWIFFIYCLFRKHFCIIFFRTSYYLFFRPWPYFYPSVRSYIFMNCIRHGIGFFFQNEFCLQYQISPIFCIVISCV